MSLYERWILPALIDKGCGAPPILKQREKVVPGATGRVLEIGLECTAGDFLESRCGGWTFRSPSNF